MSASIRKGSLVIINEFALGIFRSVMGKCYKVERIVTKGDKKYARIAGGIMVPVIVLTYAGPQKKAGSKVRVVAR